METVVCERPLVAPKDRLLGAEEVMNMNIVPAKPIQISLRNKNARQHTVRHIQERQHRQKDYDQSPHLWRLVAKTQSSCVDQWEGQEYRNKEGYGIDENLPFAEIVDNTSKIESLEYRA
jgi:hypothetical protein